MKFVFKAPVSLFAELADNRFTRHNFGARRFQIFLCMSMSTVFLDRGGGGGGGGMGNLGKK